jgi:hypothetical protein
MTLREKFEVFDSDNPHIYDMFNNTDINNILFDLIIEDGLHTFDANMSFIRNSLHKLKPNGIYITEDISHDFVELFNDTLLNEIKINNNLSYIGIINLPNSKNNHDNILLIAQKNNTTYNKNACNSIEKLGVSGFISISGQLINY